MRGLVVALLAGCSFEPGVSSAVAFDSGTTDDAPGNGDCPKVLPLCNLDAPGQALTIATADTIDTDTDPRCRTVVQDGGSLVCVVYATSVTITSGGSLTATGSRPLAIASTSMLTLAGTIDVSSRRTGGKGAAASDAGCTSASAPEADLGGAGGGAGGSFGAAGGNGGTGDTDVSQGGGDGNAAGGMAGPTATATVLRGGCRGQSGANESSGGGQGGTGGHSGGAVYLYARQLVQLSGTIRATGAGGEGGSVQAGGGGGGSGGLVVIEAPMMMITGSISANGGGGGEGGARVSSDPVAGQPGADGTVSTTPAAGGVGPDDRLGAGGAGGAGVTPAASGGSSVVGAGGGGGGVGIIRLLGNALGSGVISPPPV